MAKINKVQHGSNNFYGLSFEVGEEDVRRLSQAVVAAVWSCDAAKSPAPDGFSLEIFKSC